MNYPLGLVGSGIAILLMCWVLRLKPPQKRPGPGTIIFVTAICLCLSWIMTLLVAWKLVELYAGIDDGGE